MVHQRRTYVVSLLVLSAALAAFGLLYERGNCASREETQELPLVASALCVTVAVGHGLGVRRRWLWAVLSGLAVLAVLFYYWAGPRFDCLN
jgi:ABC-type glucose/galactose transport system permease subunit